MWTPGIAGHDVAEGAMVRFADAVPVEVRPARLAPDKHWTEEDLGHIRDVLSDSIRRHMMSDVPVGVFLSGGLDSAIVAAIAAKVAGEKGERLPTFAVGTEGSADLLAARAVAEYLGTDHHEIVPTAEDLEAALDEAVTVIEHFDPALVRSRGAEPAAGPRGGEARQGGAHRGGRRRAVRRLRVRAHARSSRRRTPCRPSWCVRSRACTSSTCSAATARR